MSPSKKKLESLSFEEAFLKLETIADRLENEQIPLDESMKAFEEGMALVKLCTDKLNVAETQLKQLVNGEDGFQLNLIDSIDSSE